MKGTAELDRSAEVTLPSMNKRPAVSVVVPLTERPESLRDLYLEHADVLRRSGLSCEFLFVAEPWYRKCTAELNDLIAAGEPIRVFDVGQGVGEATLLKLAVALCRASIIITLPPYRRVDATAITALVEQVQGGADVAVARRWPRRDSWINRTQAFVLHVLIGRLAKGRVHDVGCGVRAMKREVLESIPLYGDFFRFLPLLAMREGYRVEEVNSPQHPADQKTRLYAPGVYLRRLIDVFGLFFLLRFTEKPLRFFGLMGSVLATAGTVILATLLVQRLGGEGIADRPLLLLGVLLLVLGIQAVALGLIGEIIVYLHAPRRRPYRLMDARDQDTL